MTDAIQVVQVSKDISDKIKLLEVGRSGLRELAVNKANAIGDYRKAMEIAVFTLKAAGNAATLIKDLARGKCNEEETNMDLAESLYKIQITKMDSIKAELNGHQSIYRHLEVR